MLPVVFLLLTTLSIPRVTPSKTVNIAKYYVTPNNLSACPQGEKCDTLKYYAKNTDVFKGVEVFSLVFLDGVHNLPGEFKIFDKVAVSMVRHNNSSGIDFSNPQVVINCTCNPCATSLSNIENIELKELYFRHVAFNDSAGKHTLNATVRLDIDNVIFESAIVEIHSEGENMIFIAGTVFNRSLLGILADPQNNNEQQICMIQDTVFEDAPATSSVYYKSSILRTELNFKNVTTTRKRNPNTSKGPGDITVTLTRSARRLFLNFTECNITQSPGYGIYVETPNTGDEYQLTFDNVTITGHNEGGLAIINYSPDSQKQEFSTPTLIKKMGGKETNLRELLKRAASKWNAVSTGNPYTTIYIVDCEFSRNEAQFTDSSWVHAYTNIHIPRNGLASSLIITDYGTQSNISIVNTHFHNNSDFRLEPATMLVYNTQNVKISECTFTENIGSPILVYNAANVRIYNSNFTGNAGSAIQAYLSEITLSGNVTFRNNAANRGGAILLFLCYLNIQRDTQVYFYNNSATTVGGAIVVEQHIFSQTPRCFYQIDSTCTEDCNIQLEFNNNKAQKGGNSLYGASLKSDCFVNERNKTYKVWPQYFNFEPSKACNVTSDPTRVCFCDVQSSHTSCTELSRDVEIYPGKPFNVSAAVVGDDFGTTTGSVYAKFLNAGTGLMQLQATQWTDHSNCSQLYYTIFSNETQGNKTLVLRVEANKYHKMNPDISQDIGEFRSKGHITDELLSTPVHINVILEECPLGFKLYENTCACDIKFKVTCDISCDISTGTINRSGSTWVGYDVKMKEVIVHTDCPYQYCKKTPTPVHLSMPDTQCALNRTGTLCGKCKNGSSLMIGSSRCKGDCTHTTIALIIAFAAGGIILVIFLKVLDLTVARGTLNGLILYANILWANQSTLFVDDNGLLQYFLKPFIAWLNLDFGIESCFFEGLDDYIKAWLQFVFPLYIWTIVGLIIIAARYYNFVANWLGRNSVQVLATLVFLSYTKLLQTIIIAVEWRTLQYTNISTKVWAADGNIDYFDWKHAPLFGVTVVILVIFWTPYTLALFFHQWLKQVANHERFSWIITWKAFFEAYFGPLKDDHNYWVGLMLLVRCFLLVIFAVTRPTASPLAMILTMTILLVYAAHMGSMYKNRYLSLLENSFILNLIVVGAGMLYIKTEGVESLGADSDSETVNVNIEKRKTYVLYASIITAFLQFVGIVTYHIWTEVKRFRKQREGDNAPVVDEKREDMDVSMLHQERDRSDNAPLLSQEKQDPQDTY